ncbi:MAG: hypothetical protein EOO68_24060, partial [Moraxellaceae bacterium]
PHLSFVHGQDQVDYLKARHAGLSAHHFFSEMEYSTDRSEIGGWAPLLTEGRSDVPIAATVTGSEAPVARMHAGPYLLLPARSIPDRQLPSLLILHFANTK